MAEAPKVDGTTEFVFPDEAENKEGLQEVSADGESDIAIEVVDDTPEADRGHKPDISRHVSDVTDEELSSYSGNVQKRIKELASARHDERRAKEALSREREELERVARTIFEENQRLKSYVQSGEQVFAGTAKSAAAAKLEMAKRKYKEAHEAFDADALIAAQQELTAAQLELTAAENFRPISLQPPQNQIQQQPTEQPPRPDEQAIRWQQRNQWFGADDEMTALALAAHKRLVESGIDPRSDEYYRRIDARIREKFPENFRDEASTDGTATPRRKPATVVAPTARSSSAKKITLTQTQVTLAKKFGIPLKEYAEHVALLEANNVR
jgi:hypothetical protein